MTTKSAKHADKTFGSAKDKAAKVVDMRKVAALSVGAAGVIAGAAIAFGATPAMAAEANPVPVNTNDSAKEQSLVAKKNAEAEGSKKTATDTTKKEEAKKEEAKEAKEEPKKEQTKPAEQAVAKTDGNTDVTKNEAGSKVESIASVDNQDAKQDSEETGTPAGSVVNKRTKRAVLEENKQPEPTKDAQAENQERAANGTESQDPNKVKPDTTDKDNTKINIDENNAETMPNVYGWGSSDNTYSVDGEKHTITFHFAKPKDGNIVSIAIFPAKTNGFNNAKSERGIDFYSKDPGKHQDYSGEYTFTSNGDGSADLKMTTLFRNGNIGGAEKYTASRSIFVYVTKDNKETVAYKTNVFRAVTLVPPKTSGSVVLKYNQELTPEKVQAAITEAGNIETARNDKKSVNDQLSGTFTENIKVKADGAYDKTTFDAINTKKTGDTNSYVAGAKTLNTYMVTDLGFKSQAIPLTVARYDDRIDKPIVEDPTKLSQEVKEDIAKKLAKINGVSSDKITFDGDDNAVIHFDGVDAADAPKIALRDLVLKQIAEKDISVPAADKAVFVANPLGYSKAEIERIKQAIFDANKDNTELGLTSKDQITLEYVTGDTTVGHENIGISNGQAENTITVKIKTDKAVAEFTSNVKESKLTKLPNIRTDYDVTWTNTKIDGRDTDEGISWSNDQKTTIIYRYDPTKAQEFDTTKILGLLTATPKDNKSGLRTLNGGELLSYEGTGNNARKSHMHYALQGSEPTGELTLGNMGGAYWSGNQKVSNSDVDLGDNLSIAGSYSWDPEAGPVTVAGKKDKIFKARLFVEPYAMTYYKDVYLEKNRHPGNTAKAINVIFVPQTNHKTSDLKTSVEEHKTVAVDGNEVPTQSAYYNASDKVKSDYDDALKVAKALYDQVKDTKESDLTEKQKADIDNATIKLDKARAALDGANTDKDKLNASIEANGKAAAGSTAEKPGTVTTDRYKNVTEPDFKTPDGKTDTKKNEDAKAAKKAYDEALEKAKTVTADDNATQKAVDEAKAKLDAAREKLNEFTTNKDKLNAAIAEHGKVNTGKATETNPAEKLKTADPAYQNATDAEREAYDNAVKKANDLLADPNASQKDVNAAITALENAKKALDLKATDKSQLITAEKLTFDNPDKNDANKQSTFYKNALNKKDNGASEQEKQAAKTAVENYDNALQKARDVLKNDKATQAEVNAAKEALTNAEKVLHEKYATDADELTKVLADNFSGYLMPAYFNAFDKAQAGDADAKKAFKDYNDAYQKAKALKKKLEEAKTGGDAPDQNQIDEAKKALEKARTVIDKYATNTSRLSAAVFNDLAIQNSPAYKNVSADDASTEAKAAKTKYDDAVKKLHQALEKRMPKDQANGKDIPDTNTPDKDGNPEGSTYLDNIQAHAQGEPLDRDITKILKEMNDAIADLNKFATKTDELLKSVNEDAATHQNPAFKNASHPDYKQTDGTTADTTKNDAAKKAVDEYGKALNEAKDLLKNPSATQKQVNDAKDKLDKARKELEKYNTDTTKLDESVKKHGDTEGTAPTEGTQTSDAYRNASDPHFMKEQDGKLVPDTDKNTKAAAAKKAYDEALTKAQELLKKHGDANTPQDAKPTQTDINKALKDLDDARTEVEKYKTVTTDLEKEINKSTADGAAQPTAGSFEESPEFKNADAKKGKGDKDNEDVKAYKEALKKARNLVKAATEAGKKNSERPTQQQVDEALEALKNAKKQITDNYKTNAAALKAAKDLAAGDFKKTPEYKNADALKGDQNADAEKRNAAKKAYDALDKSTNGGALNNAIGILQAFDDDGKPNVTTGARIPTQKEVDDALKTLQEAMKTVAEGYKTDVKPLSNEVGDKDKDGNPVTPKFEESIPYKNALEKANAGDTDATSKLKDYNDKLAAAQKIIDQVNKPDPNAAADSKPTQAQVDAALKALQDAKKAIDDSFGTKIDDLKTEAAKSTADGGTVADTDFEATTEFKNADSKKTDDGKDNADVTAYKDALKKARTLLNKFDKDGKPKSGEKDIPTQKEVDEALKILKEIKDKITKNYVTSPHDLQEEVDKSKDGKDDTSTDVFENTPEFKNAQAKGDEAAKKVLDAYNEKLKAAKKLLDAFERSTGKVKQNLPDGMTKAPTQQELDKALKELQDAKKKITDDYKTDPSKLKSEADANDTFTKSPEYQNAQAKGDDASKKALEDYKKALEDANKVLGDENATQADVDAALKKLQDAKSKLSDGYKTNKSDLTAEAGKDSDFTKSPEYQNAAGSPEAEAYKRALDEANRILGDKNATQADVDAALKKLQDAKSKLVDSHKTDKSDLNTEAGKDSDFRKSIPFIIGKAADLAEYQQALNDANSVLKDPNATQAQVDQALRRLRAAKQKLIDSYNRLINSGSGVGSGSDNDFGTDTDVNTGVGVNDVNNTSVNNVVDKGALQAEVDAALGDVSANANGV
ncbi:peptidase, partial [Gardnerella vaginalis]|uniref:FIVAR domain-containing protein n=1 Tax=Gardnerella vaginalis TaxID=2702 RepID=UPI000E323D68